MTTIETTKPKSWYVANTGNHQGLVICAQTGVNIAIAYDKKNAPLIAQVPQLAESHAELLSALEDSLVYIEDVLDDPVQLACFKPGVVQRHAKEARDAIAKARGLER